MLVKKIQKARVTTLPSLKKHYDNRLTILAAAHNDLTREMACGSTNKLGENIITIKYHRAKRSKAKRTRWCGVDKSVFVLSAV